MPSGVEVRPVFSQGWLTRHEVDWDVDGSPDVNERFDYTFDAFGQPSGFTTPSTVHALAHTRFSPTRVASTAWSTKQALTLRTYGISYGWGADHRLKYKELSPDLSAKVGPSNITYTYDGLGRVFEVGAAGCLPGGPVCPPAAKAAEYTWDTAGRPLAQDVWDAGAGEKRSWTYDPAGAYGEVTGRARLLVSGAPEHEEHVHDGVTGRTTSVRTYTANPTVPDREEDYEYDGTGQLAGAWVSSGPAMTVVRYHHDLSDELVERVRTTGVTVEKEYGFGPWQQEVAQGGTVRLVESVLPQLQVEWTCAPPSNTCRAPRYVLREHDGHGIAEFDTAGAVIGAEALGAFGMPLTTGFGDSLPQNGFHGMDEEVDVGLVRMGVRHMRPGDGLWLQPEPLLGLGVPGEMLATPRSVVGVYAAGEPVVMADRSGFKPEQEFIPGDVSPTERAEIAEKAFQNGVMVFGVILAVNVPGPEDLLLAGAGRALGPVLARAGGALMGRARGAWSSLKARLPGGGSGCFVAGTEALTPFGSVDIAELRVGDLVLASTEPLETPSPDFLDLRAKPPTPFTRACAWVRRAATTAWVPAALMSACDVAPAAATSELVEVYEVRSGTWRSGVAASVDDGAYVHSGHLFKVTDGVAEDVGRADSTLSAASAPVSEWSPTLTSTSWVLADGRHVRASSVRDGERFFFGGYEFAVREGTAVATGMVVGRVAQTFVRVAEGVAALDADGSNIVGTPNHPFWVPAVNDYLALEDLEVGTVLRTYGGSEATVLGLTWMPGEVEVYDVEVEGLHNFFVRGPGSDAPGVLVHNSTRGRSNLGGTIDPSTNAAGGTVWRADGSINQNDIAPIVQSGTMRGDDVHILTGAHGYPDGSMVSDATMYDDDVDAFGDIPGVTVHNITEMSPGQVSEVVEGPGTIIGGFCNSGACLDGIKGGGQ